MGNALSEEEIALRMPDCPAWRLADAHLHREFRFPDFAVAFRFMSAVAVCAEDLDHHPDWSNSYGKVLISLQSHDVGGLTQRDFALAAAVDQAFLDISKP